MANKKGLAESIRWVVNPWFIGIQDDHETPDVPESGTWSSVAAIHRDLLATVDAIRSSKYTWVSSVQIPRGGGSQAYQCLV